MERWPEAEITGLDSSPEMICAARKAYPDRNWTTGDIASWRAEIPYDLIFSNAALQWVGNHGAVFPRLVKQVAPGGALAIQVPANIDAAAHRAMRELAESAAWRGHFPQKVREWFVDEPAFYYDAVAPLAKRIDLWTTEYIHIMPNVGAIVEWYKGTGLRPFLDLLDAEDQTRFLADFEARLEILFPRRVDGKVLFPFLRMFLIAYC